MRLVPRILVCFRAILCEVQAFAIHGPVQSRRLNVETLVRDVQGCPDVGSMPQIDLVQACIHRSKQLRVLVHHSCGAHWILYFLHALASGPKLRPLRHKARPAPGVLGPEHPPNHVAGWQSWLTIGLHAGAAPGPFGASAIRTRPVLAASCPIGGIKEFCKRRPLLLPDVEHRIELRLFTCIAPVHRQGSADISFQWFTLLVNEAHRLGTKWSPDPSTPVAEEHHALNHAEECQQPHQVCNHIRAGASIKDRFPPEAANSTIVSSPGVAELNGIVGTAGFPLRTVAYLTVAEAGLAMLLFGAVAPTGFHRGSRVYDRWAWYSTSTEAVGKVFLYEIGQTRMSSSGLRIVSGTIRRRVQFVLTFPPASICHSMGQPWLCLEYSSRPCRGRVNRMEARRIAAWPISIIHEYGAVSIWCDMKPGALCIGEGKLHASIQTAVVMLKREHGEGIVGPVQRIQAEAVPDTFERVKNCIPIWKCQYQQQLPE
mmetsp:Transcript_65019/g.152132  ORF Transcript_65019/g.152132 Transcript_65019/m.152132 type:complete len:485 (-) Transcript_65019:47-1501(-)